MVASLFMGIVVIPIIVGIILVIFILIRDKNKAKKPPYQHTSQNNATSLQPPQTPQVSKPAFCVGCGSNLDANIAFCANCGTKNN